MFTVTITIQGQEFLGAPIIKQFVNYERAYQCYEANKGEGINVTLTDTNGILMEGSKTF